MWNLSSARLWIRWRSRAARGRQKTQLCLLWRPLAAAIKARFWRSMGRLEDLSWTQISVWRLVPNPRRLGATAPQKRKKPVSTWKIFADNFGRDSENSPYKGPKRKGLSKNFPDQLCRVRQGHSGWPLFFSKYSLMWSLGGVKLCK